MFIYMFVWIGIDVQEIEGAEDERENADGGNVYADLDNIKIPSGRVNILFCNRAVTYCNCINVKCFYDVVHLVAPCAYRSACRC
jgi:hypothetical protein